jgi:methylenetetrahydrofolate reductase (NADPH)
MTFIHDLLAAGRTSSFEFFPPKTDEAQAVLEQTLVELDELAPSFVSVTYGAGGSTRERTRDIVIGIQKERAYPAMAHLTCISHTREQLTSLLEEYLGAGVVNILALAGDPPTDPDAPLGDLFYANELVELVRSVGEFSIGVAAHPELHPRSAGDREADRRHLADKLAMADFGITQFFFDAQHYLRMVDELAALGCDTTVVPGIMPVTNVGSVQRMAAMSGATFPQDFLDRLDAADGDADEVRKVGVDQATQMCQQLLDAGAPGLHFYTLNRSTATREIHANLAL